MGNQGRPHLDGEPGKKHWEVAQERQGLGNCGENTQPTTDLHCSGVACSRAAHRPIGPKPRDHVALLPSLRV